MNNRKTILTLGESGFTTDGLKWRLQQMPAFELGHYDDLGQLKSALPLSEPPDVVIVVPKEEEAGLLWVKELKQQLPRAALIVIGTSRDPALVRDYYHHQVACYLLEAECDMLPRALSRVAENRKFTTDWALEVLATGTDGHRYSTEARGGIARLTPTERRLLNMLKETPGQSRGEMAARMAVSKETIGTHLTNIFKKLSIKNIAMLEDFVKFNW